MRLIDADELLSTVKDEYELKQRTNTDEAACIVDRYVFMRVKQWIEAAVADAVQVVRCKDCVHLEGAKVNAKGFLICPNTGMDIWDECYCAHGERTDSDSKEKGGKKT